MSGKNRVNLDDGFYLVRSGEASARLPSEVVVSRTDLERVLNDYFDGVFDEPGIAIAHRLRAAVLNTENQT